MKTVEWTDVALKQLDSIWDFIAVDSIYYADKITDEIMTATEKLSTFNKIGRIIPEIGDENIREILYMSYRVMYEIRGSFIYITQIVHSAMDFKQEKGDT